MKTLVLYLKSLASRYWKEEVRVQVTDYRPGEHRPGWIATMAGNAALPPGTKLAKF